MERVGVNVESDGGLMHTVRGATLPVMRIDVWSDVVCPWCWLGKARLEKALAAFPHEVEVVFRSFQLDPATPRELDVPTDEVLQKKYRISRAQVDAMHERLRGLGLADGIEFRFERSRTSNTLDAHQLIHLAKAHGKQLEMATRLFRAQFHEGVRVGDRAELVRLATEVGLDAGEATSALEEQRYAGAVDADLAEARDLGVTGVPFFLVDGELAVSGAQSVETFRAMLEQGWARRPTPAEQAAGLCGEDGCEV